MPFVLSTASADLAEAARRTTRSSEMARYAKVMRKIALVAAIGLAACASSAPSVRVSQVVSTTSFGMCVGYCSTRLESSENRAVLIRSAHGGRGGGNLPDQRFEAVLTPMEWQAIAGAASRAAIDTLPETIGCPDCADGGAESLSI